MTGTGLTEVAKDVPQGLESGLRNYWYPILWSEHVAGDKPVPIKVLGEQLVVWRDREGRPSVLRDRCPHRAARLSIGRLLNGQLQCLFHGLRFDRAGRCVLIPWEPDDSPLCEEVSVLSYPAQDLGGYVWAYLGDTDRFPPPPLQDEIPEELTKPDEYLVFRIPNEVWTSNWLVALDGSDSFHANILHAESQAVTGKEWQGGKAERSPIPLADRRIKLVQSPFYGMRAIAVNLQGIPIHHGHMLEVKGDKFILPGLISTPLVPVPGLPPYVSRLWQFAQDEHRTHIIRYEVSWARTPQEREQWARVFEEVVGPRVLAVGNEDASVAASQGDVTDARASEFLFGPDSEVVRVRRLIKRAFTSQPEGQRLAPTRDSLVYPVVG